MLRPVFQDQLPDEDAYAAEFDRAEVTLGVLAQDAVNVRIAAASDRRGWGRSHWFGRSTWRAAKYQATAVDELRHEFAMDGERWGRLRGQCSAATPTGPRRHWKCTPRPSPSSPGSAPSERAAKARCAPSSRVLPFN